MKTQTKNNFSKKYMDDVKTLFPIIRKSEKAYLRQMKQNIADYCEQSTVSSVDELYEEFGKPQDVVYDYFSMMDITQLLSHIHLRRTIKHFFTAICAIVFAIALFVTAILYQEHLEVMRQEVIFIETTISD